MDELEKLEHQRRNPHLYTTMYQCVNADGSITTFEHITKQIRKTLSKLSDFHIAKFGGEHPVYCMKPIIGQSENELCQTIEMLNDDMDRCRLTFVTNYKHAQDRLTQLNPNKDTPQ